MSELSYKLNEILLNLERLKLINANVSSLSLYPHIEIRYAIYAIVPIFGCEYTHIIIHIHIDYIVTVIT